MNAGLVYAQAFKLKPGITLSAEQMAQLTTNLSRLQRPSEALLTSHPLVHIVVRILISSMLMLAYSSVCAQSNTGKHPTMGKALSIFERLLSFDATPLTPSFIDNETNTKLASPDINLPPEALKMLKDMGIPSPQKPKYTISHLDINGEIKIRFQFADPFLSLILHGKTTHIPLPTPLTDDSLKEHTKLIFADHQAALKKHCIDKNAMFSVLQRNGWALSNNPLSADLQDEDGNFYFFRFKDVATITMEEGCLAQLQIGTPRY